MKRAKYGNVKAVSDDGITFDSKRELKRYYVLRQREKDGLIKDLELQVEYVLLDGIYEAVPVHYKTKPTKWVRKTIQLPIKYICDFVYKLLDGTTVVEDVKISKKMRPPEYMLKRKLFRYYYGYNITEIYEPDI